MKELIRPFGSSNKLTMHWDVAPSLSLIMLSMILTACTALPSKYINQAEPGVTLTALTASPQQYRDKVVILGGVLVK